MMSLGERVRYSAVKIANAAGWLSFVNGDIVRKYLALNAVHSGVEPTSRETGQTSSDQKLEGQFRRGAVGAGPVRDSGGGSNTKDYDDPPVIDSADAMDILKRSVGTLNASDRQIFYERFVEGCRVADIAESMGISPRSLYIRINRILDSLRRHLESENVDPSRIVLPMRDPADEAQHDASERRLVATIAALRNAEESRSRR